MFKLNRDFLKRYSTQQAPFGFEGLGELVYRRTYSRIKTNGVNEEWYETVKRVVEGTFTMQQQWIEKHQLGWNSEKAQKTAQQMYDRIFTLKFLPPGRGLWAMGSPIINKRKMYAALNNCAFVSTATIDTDFSKPFEFLMDMSMLGVGVGFDTKGTQKITIHAPIQPIRTITIADSREGWVDSVKQLIHSYFVCGQQRVEFDYSAIRAAGLPIKVFGGTSSGYEPLEELHVNIRNTLDACVGQPISTTVIVDIQNYIGKCVVAGNVRRTAEIVFGDYKSDEYLDLKNYEKNPQRMMHGWTSNNSIFADIGMDYTDTVERIKINGEPGIAWLETMRNYSRMCDAPDHVDHRVTGGNPCLEQSLESYELCCLVETFPNNHESLQDFLITLKYAYMYAKTVTLGETHWPETNRVLLRNRRIGCSISGIAQFIADKDIHTLKQWCETGYKAIERYDTLYSDWFAIPRSIKKTSVKPSGTVSLLAGATPGIHFPENEYYIRRVRLARTSELIEPLQKAGYIIEPCFGSEDTTLVVEIPIHVQSKQRIRTVKEVSIWEQLAIAAFMQKYWADNQVSATITFRTEEADQIIHALNVYQYQLKGVSFLPLLEHGGAYKQMPYEAIDKETYTRMKSNLSPLVFTRISNEQADIERFCTNDQCVM
jgi:hypothetical protein